MTVLIGLEHYLKASITFRLLLLAILADTVFGCVRAIRKRALNSAVGIDGAIRKVSMILAAVFMGCLDLLVDLNFLALIPADVRDVLGLTQAGAMTILCLLFVAYEAISILKNMVLCGLPVRGVLKVVYEFLSKNTTELPDMDELESEE